MSYCKYGQFSDVRNSINPGLSYILLILKHLSDRIAFQHTGGVGEVYKWLKNGNWHVD